MADLISIANRTINDFQQGLGTGRNDVANGMLIMRELAIKDALRQGPVGLLTSGSTIKSVRWLKPETK